MTYIYKILHFSCSGGAGGVGNLAHGGHGSLEFNCSCGGNAGAMHCNHYRDVYCGVGGASHGCQQMTKAKRAMDQMELNKYENNRKNWQCGRDRKGVNGGSFGGGSAGLNGGGGGGGGISCKQITHYGNRAYNVVVGYSGKPSYGRAGRGLVLVMWGMGDSCGRDVNKTLRRKKRRG